MYVGGSYRVYVMTKDRCFTMFAKQRSGQTGYTCMKGWLWTDRGDRAMHYRYIV